MGGNQVLISWLQRAVGYSLTGMTSERCFFLLHGIGANGKTTFLEIVRAIAGDYATQTDFTTFLEKKSDGPRNDIARLFGARVVTSSEVGEGKRFAESLVKSLTGAEMITARFLNRRILRVHADVQGLPRRESQAGDPRDGRRHLGPRATDSVRRPHSAGGARPRSLSEAPRRVARHSRLGGRWLRPVAAGRARHPGRGARSHGVLSLGIRHARRLPRGVLRAR
jgi:hypothetical protein